MPLIDEWLLIIDYWLLRSMRIRFCRASKQNPWPNSIKWRRFLWLLYCISLIFTILKYCGQWPQYVCLTSYDLCRLALEIVEYLYIYNEWFLIVDYWLLIADYWLFTHFQFISGVHQAEAVLRKLIKLRKFLITDHLHFQSRFLPEGRPIGLQVEDSRKLVQEKWWNGLSALQASCGLRLLSARLCVLCLHFDDSLWGFVISRFRQ